MRILVNFKKSLPPTFAAVRRITMGGRQSRRWMIYDGADLYRGDLIRWNQDRSWSWHPYRADCAIVSKGTLEACLTQIRKLAD
jgi:hypothetical protein